MNVIVRWQPVLLFALGLGLGAIGQRRADAFGGCPLEGQCSFKKPNFMVVLDYSSAMNADFGNGQTRWQAAVEALQGMITGQNGYFEENMHFAMVRFGHDPDPAAAGTTIVGDLSGLVDGVSLDVEWYDPATGPDFPYYECNGASLVAVLEGLPAPPLGIESWAFGGLEAARGAIEASQVDHPADLDPVATRLYANILVTPGVWTEADGVGMDPAQDPVIVAGDLYADLAVPTFVVSFDDPVGSTAADAIAMAGGTTAAYQADDPQGLYDAVQMALQAIIDGVIVPECTAGQPRIMIVLDASSAMLNVAGVAGAQGTTPWDQAREALAGSGTALFDTLVMAVPNMPPLEDLVHVGLIAFGNANETELLVQYGACMQDNVAWALDPSTSCSIGCNDPWGGPPIAWTFVDGSIVDPPGFDEPTTSHMPRCDVDGALPGACTGSVAYTHLGLALASFNQLSYAADPPATADSATRYINLLVTSGDYDSTDAQVMSELTSMYAEGVTTYVLGLGEVVPAQLANMACWGSGGAGNPCQGGTIAAYDAGGQGALEQAFADIVAGIAFDPCCSFNDCSYICRCSTNEPDPIPPSESSSSGGPDETTSGVATGGSTGAGTLDDGGSAGTSTASSSTGADSSASEDGGPFTTASGTSPPTSTTFGTTASEDDGSSGVGQGVTDSSCGCRERPRGTPSLFLGALAMLVRRRSARS